MICKTCKHCKIDEQWGERKCLFYCIRINDERTKCDGYRPKKGKEKKK